MKKLAFSLLLLSVCLASAQSRRSQSTFAGVLLSGQGQGAIAGNITLKVDNGRVSFQSTLFQPYVTNTSLEPVLVVQRKTIPFSFGTGTPGSFRFEEFLGPIPGMNTSTPCGGFPEVDPGFELPLFFDGTRFTGSFTASPSLERLLLTKGGTVYLQINGTVAGLQDPVFNALLVNVVPPSTNRFVAELSGANEVTPNASPSHASATFALTGNCLQYTLAGLDLPCFPLVIFPQTDAQGCSIAILGPANKRSNSTNVVASLTPFIFTATVGTGQISSYMGSVSLSDDAIADLKRGKLYVNISTAQYPNGEIRGQILPACDDDQRRHGFSRKERDSY